jgi:hypothetical protein
MGLLGSLDDRIIDRSPQSLAPGTELVQESQIPPDDGAELRRLIGFEVGTVHANTVRESAARSTDGLGR